MRCHLSKVWRASARNWEVGCQPSTVPSVRTNHFVYHLWYYDTWGGPSEENWRKDSWLFLLRRETIGVSTLKHSEALGRNYVKQRRSSLLICSIVFILCVCSADRPDKNQSFRYRVAFPFTCWHSCHTLLCCLTIKGSGMFRWQIDVTVPQSHFDCSHKVPFQVISLLQLLCLLCLYVGLCCEFCICVHSKSSFVFCCYVCLFIAVAVSFTAFGWPLD